MKTPHLRHSLLLAAVVTGSTAAQDALNPVQAPAEELKDVVVAADRETRTEYSINEAPSLLKLDVPLSETPQSVAVVTKEVLQDQAAQNLKDTFRNVSGVFESGNTLNAQSEVLPVIRGFEAPFVFRNGMRATQVGSVDLFNIESVEVIKGPASILFGGLEPGGVLNYNTKRPLATPFHEIVQSFGSYDYYRTTIDSTGPLDSQGRFLYRLNAAYTNSESFRDFMDVERVAVAPSITWRISDDTELGFDFAYTKEKQPYDTGVPVAPDGTPLVPIETFFGDPHLAGRTLEDTFAGMDFKHRFNGTFTLRSRVQFHRAEPENEALRNRGVAPVAGGGYEVRQRYQNEARVDDEYQFVTDLLMNFTTGPVKHNALIGLDLIRQESQFDRFRVNTPNVPVTPFPNVSFIPPPGSNPVPDIKGNMEWAALYAQDQMSALDDRLHFLVGGRFDWVDQQQSLPASSSSEESELTGRAGLLYEVADWLSPYVSISQSFRPQTLETVDKNGQVLEPHTGHQIEGGFKFDFCDDRLIATLSAYQIEKQNVAVFDNTYFNNTNISSYYPGVEQQSRGVELDITGKITETLSIVANYAYTDTETLENPEAPTMVGRRLGGVPLNAARLWLAYNFAEESTLKGLGFGAGVRFESERLASFADQVTLDNFVLFDAGIWYRHELENGQAFKTQLNFQNITDEEYYPRASDQSIVHPGAPFGVVGSIGYEF
ncbi:TonB-dependent siderophore receptor [Luteolibacter sp. Populi]|uniref:TonB-dependent siderophore receptor n=1 Tax=Luteolibacter sp. Populi TaxID=3230487 RepID=UPI003465C518